MKRKMLVSITGILIFSGLCICALENSLQMPELETCYVRAEPIPEMKQMQKEEKLIDRAPTLTEDPEPQPECDIREEDKALLARIAKAEAGNQDIEGKALVICVVLNRKESPDFPDSVSEIIYQENQFSPVLEGKFDKTEPDGECWQALEMVLQGGWDESQGALYFESEGKSSWHRENLTYLFTHGDHWFYIDREQ